MRCILSRLALFIFSTISIVAAQTGTRIDPNTQINWPQSTGTGAPVSSCSVTNYGAPYLDTASGNSYVCKPSGWSNNTINLAAPGPIGGTTPGSGSFSTIKATSGAASMNSVLYPKTPPYNAYCDGSSPTSITLTSGSNVTSGVTFTSADIGKLFWAWGTWGFLNTTITGLSGSNAVLGANAPATVAVISQFWMYGHDDRDITTNGGVGTGLQAMLTDAKVGSSNGFCFVSGCQIQWPSGICLSSALVYEGQPLKGSGMMTSTLQGLPGQDVLPVPDTAGGVPQSTHWQDLRIVVDGNINASATAGGGNNAFPNRIAGTAGGTTPLPASSGGPPAPGQARFGPGGGTGTCSASITAGSAVLTATCQNFSNAPAPNIINAPITVNGAGAQTAITAWSITSNVATFTATNTLSAGTSVYLNGFGTSTFFNTQYVTVLAAGLSGSQFTAAIAAHANGSATEAGQAGLPLTTTILSTTGNTVTMNANSQATGTGVSGMWGAPNLAPWYIGNCALAFPHSDQNVNRTGPNGWTFTNVYFYSTNFGVNSLNKNHECGVFLQAQPYNLHWDKVNFQGMWIGLAEAFPAQNFSSSIIWTPDTTTYTDMNFSGTMIAASIVNGSHRTFQGSFNIYNAQMPFATGLWDFVYGNNVSTVDIKHIYDEGWSSNTGESGRIGGSNGSVWGGNMMQAYSYPPPYDQYINVTGSNNQLNVQMPSIHVTGNVNTVRGLYPGTGVNGYLVDSGLDNDIGTYFTSGSGTRRFNLNRARRPMNTPDSGWLLSGSALSPYASADDLVATCPEFTFAFIVSLGAPGCTSDLGSVSASTNQIVPDYGNFYGSYVHTTVANNPSGFTLGNGGSQGTGPVGKQFTIYDRIPQAALVNFVMNARCDNPCTQSITLRDARTNAILGGPTTLSFGTTWTPQILYGANLLTGTLPGDVVNIVGGVSTGAGVTWEDIQVMGFQPIPADFSNLLRSFSAGINFSGTNSPLQCNTDPGTSGQLLKSNGPGATCGWTTAGATPAVTWWASGPQANTASSFPPVANKTVFYDFMLPVQVTATIIGYHTSATADNTANLYDIGIYSLDGLTRLAHTGALAGTTFAPTANTSFNQTISGGAVTFPAGNYIVAVTTNCASACATLGITVSGAPVSRNSTAGSGVTSGGVLNTTVTPGTITYGGQTNTFWFMLH